MKISLQLFFTLFLISGLSAQSEIKGKLVDLTTGESIPFGHIVIVDKKTGVLSDESGAFTLMGVDASDTISFTSVGYIEKRIVAANINAETIGLERKNNLLEELDRIKLQMEVSIKSILESEALALGYHSLLSNQQINSQLVQKTLGICFKDQSLE